LYVTDSGISFSFFPLFPLKSLCSRKVKFKNISRLTNLNGNKKRQTNNT
jgi:hypothetical protein